MKEGTYCPGGPEKGFPLVGTDKRRALGAAPLQETGREEAEMGDCSTELNRLGLPVAAEKVAEVGVVTPLD